MKRILCVEDNEDNVYVMRTRLGRAGYTVLIAADGEQGLAMAAAEKPDLIVMSCRASTDLPCASGLRAQDATRDIPVVFLTALDDTIDKAHAFSVGAVDYVTKPFRSEELLARVGTHLALCPARRALEEQNARLREEIEAHHRSRGNHPVSGGRDPNQPQLRRNRGRVAGAPFCPRARRSR